MFKVNNKDTRTTPIVVVLVSLLLTLNIFHTLFYVSIVNFEQVNADYKRTKCVNQINYKLTNLPKFLNLRLTYLYLKLIVCVLAFCKSIFLVDLIIYIKLFDRHG